MILDSTKGKGRSAVHVTRRPRDGFCIEQSGHRVLLSADEANELVKHILLRTNPDA